MAQKLSQEEQSALAAYRRRQEMIAKKHDVISKLNIVEIIDLRSEPNNVHDSYYGTETRIGLWAQERRRCGSPVTRDSLESALDMLNIEIGNSSHWTALKSEIEDGAIEEDEDTPLTLLYFPEGDGEPVYVELDPDWITDAFWGEKELNVSSLRWKSHMKATKAMLRSTGAVLLSIQTASIPMVMAIWVRFQPTTLIFFAALLNLSIILVVI